MSPKPAIILHKALLREFYMACDWSYEIWGVSTWHPLISERQILKQTLKWAASPPPSYFLPNIKGTESPSAFKRKVKRCTFSARFRKWSHLKAICLGWNLSLSPIQRAVTLRCHAALPRRAASADGDRHPSCHPTSCRRRWTSVFH